MTARAMAFGTFLEALNLRLDQMSEHELKEAIRVLASDLRPAERPSFLAGLSPGEARKVMGDGLPDEIEDLMGRIRSREFYEGSGWDDRIHAERAFRDESWVSEMDALFDGASNAFQAGRLDTRYPRHVAFRRELDRLCASSPAVGRP